MPEDEREEHLAAAGFSDEQIDALIEIFALHGHSHAMSDVIGLDEELSDIEAEILDIEDE
jgi:hypothetical protein